MARAFDGVDDKISFGNYSAINNVLPSTAYALVRPTATVSAERQIMTKMANGWQGKMWLFVDATNSLGCYFTKASGTETWVRSSNNVLTVNAWNVLICTHASDGTLPTLYCCTIGGTLTNVNNTSQQGTGTQYNDSANELWVGGRQQADSTFWNGHIADVALWNRVLSAGELTALCKGFAPLFFPSGRVLYSRVSGRYSPELNLSGATHGTLTGTSYVDHAPVLYPIAQLRSGTPPANTNYTITAESGTVVWSGSSAFLTLARRVPAASGSLGLTGSSAALRVTRRLPAASAAYTLTGSVATLRISRRLAADSGSVAISGANAALILARRLVAGAASYAITGIDAALKIARRIAADSASVVITGTDAGLSSSNNKTINAESGSVSISGSAATLRIARVVSAQSGSYSLDGTDAGLKITRRIPCDTRAFVCTGQSASVLLGKRFSAQSGAMSIDGTLATLLLARKITASPSAYLITGMPAAVIYSGGRVVRRIVLSNQAIQRPSIAAESCARPSIASESCAVPTVTGESVL